MIRLRSRELEIDDRTTLTVLSSFARPIGAFSPR